MLANQILPYICAIFIGAQNDKSAFIPEKEAYASKPGRVQS
jgi:hypothetical protein